MLLWVVCGLMWGGDVVGYSEKRNDNNKIRLIKISTIICTNKQIIQHNTALHFTHSYLSEEQVAKESLSRQSTSSTGPECKLNTFTICPVLLSHTIARRS